MSDVVSGSMIGSSAEFSIGGVFSRTFSILGRNFAPFALISAVATLPYVLFYWNQTAAVPGALPKFNIDMALPFIVGFVLKMLIQAVIVYAAFQDMRRRPVAIGESFGKALPRLAPILGLMIVEGLAVGFGTILLIVPGIILMMMWYVALPVCVVEQLGPIESLGRSSELTKGHRWKLFGLVLIVGIVGLIIGATIPIAGRLIFGRVGFVITQYLVQTVVGAFGAILVIVIYHDLRVAKEGIDTDQIAAVFD